MKPHELKVAVFASGKGSNVRALLDAVSQGKVPRTHIVLVLSNNSAAGALAIARERGIAAVHLSRMQFESDGRYESALSDCLRSHGANFIALAGYMKKIPNSIVRDFKNRIINIHPALLPAFGGEGMYGARVHEAVIASGARVSGATVHLVDEEYDRGSVVLQREVPVLPGDSSDTLAKRVLAVEHEIYPEALRLFAEDRVRIENGRVSIS